MDQDAEIWRRALQAKGRDWVVNELRMRPGQPDDVVYDVVFKEPLPTRAFCWRWCVEQDNKIFHLAGSTRVALIVLVLLVIFVATAVHFWGQTLSQQTARELRAARPAHALRN